MTFSQEAKIEALKSLKNAKGCCAASFLAAVLKASGSLTLEFHKYSFTVQSDNYDFLTTCKTLSVKHLGCSAEVYASGVNVKGVAMYCCRFEDNIGDKLGLTTHADNVFELLSDNQALIPQSECCRRSFMQGLFVSCGSVVVPVEDLYYEEKQKRAKYHLELRLTDGQFALAVQRAFAAIDFKLIQRKNHFVLYVKDSEQIADFLAYVSATRSRLKLDNVILGRSVRNKINRQNNCSVANIDKTVEAAQKQLSAIALLKQVGAYGNLPQSLKDAAEIRSANPEATLDEIAALLKISKSGANHRFAKIIELASSEENK